MMARDVVAGDVILRVTGDARSLLTLERTVVNLMQRMSGIATATKNLVTVRPASVADGACGWHAQDGVGIAR